MRNRGVEIYVADAQGYENEITCVTNYDLMSILYSAGISNKFLVAMLLRVHSCFYENTMGK